MTVLAITVFVVIAFIAIHYATVKKGCCPGCRDELSFHGDVGRCPHCGIYFYQMIDGDPLQRVMPGFISRYPSIAVDLGALKHPSAWTMPWPGRCCVCGNEATRTKKLKFRFSDYQEGIGWSNEKTYKISFPHCQKHLEGYSCLKDEVDRPYSLSFCSFDYCNEFYEQNRDPRYSLVRQQHPIAKR